MISESIVREHRDKIAYVLFQIIRTLDQAPIGDLPTLMRERNGKLIEFLQEENRLLAHANGEEVPVKAHFAEMVAVGVFGGGSTM